MVIVSSFYDHWMPRYSTKHQKCVSPYISASSVHRRMRHSSLEPSRRAASNGDSFILLRPLDAEIFNETSKMRFAIYLSIQRSQKDAAQLIRTVSPSCIEW